MNAVQNTVQNNEIQEEPQSNGTRLKLGDYIPIYIPGIDGGLLNQSRHEKKKRFLDFLKARPSNEWFLKVLRRNPSRDNESSSPSETATNHGHRRRFRVPFVRKINWGSLWKSFKRWIKSPVHIAFFIWLLFVAAGLLMLFLIMTGILNGAISSSERRKDWSEKINQILNALFTMLALYEHPKFCHQLILLLRWRPGDEAELRKAYSKNGSPTPNERAHFFFVVTLLHITCFAQYAFCGLYWGYTRTTRPDWAEDLTIGIGIGAPVIAGLYTSFGPLGRTNDEPQAANTEHQNQMTEQVEPEALHRKIIITSPEWIGGLFDCMDDKTLSCHSFFCTFCVFGWNMERLGFGNMYVHIITFALLCIAPFWVFAISALNVDDDTIKLILVIIGGVLCIFGLLYGGFWRTEMRKKFKLPGNRFICGSSTITDYMQWLFCWSCSLAQEVRTANFYDIEDDGFYRRVTDEEGRAVLIPLPREGSLSFLETYERSRSCPPTVVPMNVQRFSDGVSIGLPFCFGRALTCPADSAMAPPFTQQMRVDEERLLKSIELSSEKQVTWKIEG